MILRDYQQQMIDDVHASGARCTLAVMPTASGKTPVMAVLARDEPEPALIAAHRIELINQASAKLSALDVPHGIISPGHPPTRHRVQVGSIQTIINRLPLLQRFGLILPDEAHHCVSKSWERLFAAQQQARVVGFTATPERLDGRGLGDVFGAMIVGPNIPELTARGYLCPVRVFAPARGPDLSQVRSRAGDYNPDDLDSVMCKPSVTGDAAYNYESHAPGVAAIGFCHSVAAAHDAAAAFRAEGWRFEAIHGASDDRAGLLAALAAGKLHGLMSCSLIDEGVDLPNVGCVIDLAPTKSLSRFMQRVGREMRTAAGKTSAVLLDHAGNCFQHGMPDMARTWSLAAKRTKGAGIAVAQCPECYALHSPAAHCPACGYDYSAARATAEQRELERRKGELALLTLEDRRLEHLRTAPIGTLLKAARTHADLEEIATARKFHPGWVDHRARFLPRPKGVD